MIVVWLWLVIYWFGLFVMFLLVVWRCGGCLLLMVYGWCACVVVSYLVAVWIVCGLILICRCVLLLAVSLCLIVLVSYFVISSFLFVRCLVMLVLPLVGYLLVGCGFGLLWSLVCCCL